MMGNLAVSWTRERGEVVEGVGSGHVQLEALTL